jgi:hypothetical protein
MRHVAAYFPQGVSAEAGGWTTLCRSGKTALSGVPMRELIQEVWVFAPRSKRQTNRSLG